MRKILPLSILLASLCSSGVHGADSSWTAEELWESWPSERFVTTVAPCLRPARLRQKLSELAARHPERLRLEEVGRSVRNRPIQLLTLGTGERKVFLWSQMHGDEPSATPALLDVTDYLLSNPDHPDAKAILADLTLLVLPMVNPDGSEIFSRRNAQDIDINRDALNLATPEGRLLKKLRDLHQPFLGFNLHDQNSRTAVGHTGRLATNAVLAVSGDPQGTVTPGRRLAKRACSAVATTLAPFMPGGMARYDEDWSPRAFGDNITAWGTPVVLIESGGLPAGHPVTDLARLNFVALLTVLRDLVRDNLASHDPAIYEALERNETDIWSDVIVRGGSILQPGSRQPYRADLAFNRLRSDREIAGCGGNGATTRSAIMEIGDTRYRGFGREIDASSSLIVAPLVAGVEGWKARRWLNGPILDRFAQLGVGTLYWAVREKHRAGATTLAYALRAPGRTRIEVIPETSPRPPLQLTGPPGQPRSRQLGELLRALQPSAKGPTGEAVTAASQEPWQFGPQASEGLPPRIRRGRPASFLLLSHPPGEELNLESAELQAVWIHGVEAGATP